MVVLLIINESFQTRKGMSSNKICLHSEKKMVQCVIQNRWYGFEVDMLVILKQFGDWNDES